MNSVKKIKTVKDQKFDEERAFYGESDLEIIGCRFEGEADGESAFKECKNISVKDCYWELRYPFWHDEDLRIVNTYLTEKCRAALWYSENISIKESKLHGVKALRECTSVDISDTDIISPEFGWSVDDVHIENSSAQGEYFMLRSSKLVFKNFKLQGKYSFQYVTDSYFENCIFDTKDAFWHAKNVVVKNSVVNGEYLAWYAENITFENCKIKGTQPLCYCKGLKLINCEMEDADLSFEKSEVEASIIGHILSIKNPASGNIRVLSVGEIINDDPKAKGIVLVGNSEKI